MARILSSRITLGISIAYLIFAFCVTLTWYMPQLSRFMPRLLEQWMYPINKTDLDVLRFVIQRSMVKKSRNDKLAVRPLSGPRRDHGPLPA